MSRKKSPPKKELTAQPDPIRSIEITSGLDAINTYGEQDSELYIKADGQFFVETFTTERILTAEENNSFIKKVEAIVRGSREYKMWVSYLRNDLNMNRCSFLSNIDTNATDVSLEMHHCPLTLYDIVDIILTHRLDQKNPVTSLTLADEVIQAHMLGIVGVVPLTETVHKLVHANAIKVHPSQVHGNWLKFVRTYNLGITEAIMTKLLAFCNTTEDEVVELAHKIDGSKATPLLRSDAIVVSTSELEILRLSGGTGER